MLNAFVDHADILRHCKLIIYKANPNISKQDTHPIKIFVLFLALYCRQGKKYLRLLFEWSHFSYSDITYYQ